MSERQVTVSTKKDAAPDTATSEAIPGEKLFAKLREFSKAQATLTATALATGIFILRCLSVTKFDFEQAHALFMNTSIGDAVRAVAFAAFMPILLSTSLVLAFYAGGSFERRGLRHPLTINYAAVGFLSSALAIFISGKEFKGAGGVALMAGVGFYLLGAAGIGIYVARQTNGARRSETTLMRGALRKVVAGVLAALLLYSLSLGLLTPTMWLPLEEFFPQQGSPYMGYLLKESSGTFFVLGEKDRYVHEFSKDAVRYRIRCQGYPVKCSDPSLSRLVTPPPTPTPANSPTSPTPSSVSSAHTPSPSLSNRL